MRGTALDRTGTSRTSSTSAPARSAWRFRAFRKYGFRYLSKHFHSVRLERTGYRPAAGLTGPVVVVVNHPSWWDPMTGLVLSTLWPDKARHFAPIEAAGLLKYPFLERLGFFGIESETARGGIAFLRQSLAALAEPDGVLWITAQGKFVDTRERPTRIKPGVGHLAHRLASSGGHVLPLAFEYPFWNESKPEALARFGPPISLAEPHDPDAWTATIEQALQDSQDALSKAAISRDPSRFETILSGGAGVGGVYDLWRRFKSAALSKRFVAEHVAH